MKQFRMVFVAIIALTGLVGSFAIGFSTAATASSTLPGVCLTVSLSEIRSTLGGAPSAPKYKNLACNYGSVSISYTSTALVGFKKDMTKAKGKLVRHLGTSAYSFQTTHPSATDLAVLDHRITFVITSTTGASLSRLEALARKMVPLF